MAKSPFVGKLDLNQMHVHMQVDRQESFENRIVESIFRGAGIPPARLRMHVKRLAQGTPATEYTMDWFNHFSNYPVKLAALRFHSKRRFSELLRDMRLGTRFDKTPEIDALVDLHDGWPGVQVALISRYPDWADDLVFYRTPRDEPPAIHALQFRLQRADEDWIYTLELLKVFTAKWLDSWVIEDIFTL